MARLPVAGADGGVWGNILNNFLSQAHNANGTLKTDAVGAAALAAGSGSNGQVLTKDTGTVSGIKWAAAGGASDATSSAKGVLRLTGELGGTADSPTVPELANKADKAIVISAGTGLTGGGNLSANRSLAADFGVTSGTIAEGNHTHAAAQSSVYPLSAYGLVSATAPIETCTVGSTIGPFFAARVFVPAGTQIVGSTTFVRAAGTVGAGGENGFGIYEDDGVLAMTTITDDNLWATQGWRSKAFPTPVAAQSSDRFVYVCIMVNGYSGAPSVLYNVLPSATDVTGGGYNMPNHRRSFYSGASSWPASFDPQVYGSDPGGYTPFIGLA